MFFTVTVSPQIHTLPWNKIVLPLLFLCFSCGCQLLDFKLVVSFFLFFFFLSDGPHVLSKVISLIWTKDPTAAKKRESHQREFLQLFVM